MVPTRGWLTLAASLFLLPVHAVRDSDHFVQQELWNVSTVAYLKILLDIKLTVTKECARNMRERNRRTLKLSDYLPQPR